MKKAGLRDRILIYSAGVGANLILALIFLLILAQAANGLAVGVKILQVDEHSPAYNAGLKPGMIITSVNGKPVKTVNDLIRIFEEVGVKDSNKTVTLTLTVNYNGENKTIIVTKPEGETRIGIYITQAYTYSWLVTFLKASYIINFSLALVNAAPLAIPLPGGVLYTDGGQIIRDAVAAKWGERKGNLVALIIGVTTLVILLSLMSLTRLSIS
jgi:membrane-associated protease RseP (regulator of RpoE activity)